MKIYMDDASIEHVCVLVIFVGYGQYCLFLGAFRLWILNNCDSCSRLLLCYVLSSLIMIHASLDSLPYHTTYTYHFPSP